MTTAEPATAVDLPEPASLALVGLPEELSARRITTLPQRALAVVAAAALVAAAIFSGVLLTVRGLDDAILLFYGAILFHRALILLAGWFSPPMPAAAAARAAGSAAVPLPLVSILVPLYHEGPVVSGLVAALDRLDYPRERLEVLLLLEEDDDQTRRACDDVVLPPYFRCLTVPPGTPRTKPRACNFGLWKCQGAITVVYDAEDQPEPDQLLGAVRALAEAPPEVACVQAKLAYYNPRQNLLTRWFAAEYLSWFELMLPGLAALRAPLPLGGTSNIFRTEALRRAGGWDSWNVAEDCDLGIRLYRSGCRVALLGSTTWEEACPGLPLWIRQRSRWIKGYLQTWLVHNRHPARLLRDLGLWKFLNMQLLVGGAVACLLLNPIYWGLTLFWWLHPTRLESLLFGGPALALGNVCWVFGNLFFVFAQAAGALRKRQWDLAAFALMAPLYWLLMSAAAWKALLQIVIAPHHWEKTTHGLGRLPHRNPLAPARLKSGTSPRPALIEPVDLEP